MPIHSRMKAFFDRQSISFKANQFLVITVTYHNSSSIVYTAQETWTHQISGVQLGRPQQRAEWWKTSCQMNDVMGSWGLILRVTAEIPLETKILIFNHSQTQTIFLVGNKRGMMFCETRIEQKLKFLSTESKSNPTRTSMNIRAKIIWLITINVQHELRLCVDTW